jgi:branched-chain amino acid transport system substrate-binding protein
VVGIGRFRRSAAPALLALLVAACGPGGGADGADASAGDPIRIGVVTSLTGPFAPFGIQVEAGMRLAVDELNAAGGVDGRPVELVVADDAGDPEEAVTAYERMVEQDGVVAVGGLISSDVALATSRVAEELEVPLFLVKAGADGVLTRDSRHTFRTCLVAASMTAGPLADYVEDEGLRRVGVVVADYAWGQAVRAAVEDVVGGLDGVEVQVEVAPVGETDFTTYLRSLQAFEPDVIAATGHPPGLPSIVLQATDLGMDVPIIGAYGALGTLVERVGDAADDRYVDYECVDYSTPEYQDLARRFAAATDLGFMEDDAVAGYGIVQVVAESVGEVGEDPAAVAEHVRTGTFSVPGYAFDLAWTEWGELARAREVLVVIRRQDPPAGVNDGADWYPEVLLVSDPLEPHVPE